MFDVFNEIEGAPNLLLSAQRHYITRYNSTVAESSAALNMKVGDKLCILVFSDLLVICKRKRSLLGKNDKGSSSRTPSRVNSGRKEKKEELVYRGLINAVEIMKILDIKETFECQRCFSYCVKRNGSKFHCNVISPVVSGRDQGSESSKICLVLVPCSGASLQNVLVLVHYF